MSSPCTRDQFQFFSDTPYPPHKFTTKSIGQIFNEFTNGDIFTHPCQRNFVWDIKQQQKFLTTISKLGPISGPQFNQNLDSISEIMDGQNRIKTIVQFMNDDISFKNENGIIIKYSQMSLRSQRIFKNIQVGFTETREWTSEQCEENFCEIQEGMPLKAGEIINSSSNNPVTILSKEISDHFGDFLTNSVKNCGMGINIKRHKDLEILSTLMNMVMKDQFPQKTAKTSLDLYDSFKSNGDGDPTDLEQAKQTVIKIIEAYKFLVKSIPELQKGGCKENYWESAIGEAHMLRSVYFVKKIGIRPDNINDEIVMKFKNMIIKTHHIHTEEDKRLWDDMKLWAQNDIERIYEKYLEFYNQEM
jgi:hypothetical protein